MKIYFDKLYKDERRNELCGICVPFKRGCLQRDKVKDILILDGDKSIPVQTEITSVWDDGSVRYLYVYFLVCLPGNAAKELELVTDYEAESDRSNINRIQLSDEESVRISKENTVIIAENGEFSFTVKDNSKFLFDEFRYHEISFERDMFVGPLVSVDGDRLSTVFERWEIVKSGKLFSQLKASGRCISDRGSVFSGDGICFEMRISLTAGKPWMDMGFRFINCTDKDIKPDDIVFAVKREPGREISYNSPRYVSAGTDSTGCGDTKGTDVSGNIVTTMGINKLGQYDFKDLKGCSRDRVRCIAARSNYRTEFKISEGGDPVENIIIAEMLEKEANEHFPEVFYGTFMADFTDPSTDVGVCATVFQAFQNFPKAVRSDENGITVFIIPDQELTSGSSRAKSVVFTSGMSRETRVLLHFHSAAEPIYELDNRSLIYQMPDRPYIDPDEFAMADVMPDVFLPAGDQVDDVEIALIDRADSHARCYGMLNFGDAPDPGYTSQGRGGGDLVWTNNEYDYPHAMYMMYARSGIRRFFDYATVAAYHWMDVDVCHYSKDPLRMGGQWEHTRRHTGGSEEGDGCKGEMVCSHEWVEGLIDLYHFTGDERALKTAIGIGENVQRLLDTPMYQVAGESSARETGWALRTLTALYVETWDEKWVSKCRSIISQFEAWNERYGGWLSPYTDNTTIRVGFMISVAVGSLMRFYRVFPDENLRKMILGAIDDLARNFMTRQGLFIYKELPSLDRNGTNTLLLESMAIGYELTSDRKYLEFGEKTFERAIKTSQSSSGTKRITEDTVIVGSGPTKNFAQSFFPLTSFYVQSIKSK